MDIIISYKINILNYTVYTIDKKNPLPWMAKVMDLMLFVSTSAENGIYFLQEEFNIQHFQHCICQSQLCNIPLHGVRMWDCSRFPVMDYTVAIICFSAKNGVCSDGWFCLGILFKGNIPLCF